LKVIPVINPDNSIIMEIEASNSTPGQTFTNADLPGINKKEAKTKVLVFDGDTTVIGGIFVEDDSETESGVPWLMNIPFLGHLVKSTNVEKRRSELLIFITPRILE
jgi:type IV pilus assembly protein PilQ